MPWAPRSDRPGVSAYSQCPSRVCVLGEVGQHPTSGGGTPLLDLCVLRLGPPVSPDTMAGLAREWDSQLLGSGLQDRVTLPCLSPQDKDTGTKTPLPAFLPEMVTRVSRNIKERKRGPTYRAFQ